MKLLVVLGVLAAGYLYVLMHTTDMVLAEVQDLNAEYQSVADNADKLATGH